MSASDREPISKEETCTRCNGAGTVEYLDTTKGPDADYFTAICPKCEGAAVTVKGTELSVGYVTSAEPLESIDDCLAIVASYGPYGNDIRFEYRCQILLAEEVKRLRANDYHDAYCGAYDRARIAEKRLKAAEEELRNLRRLHFGRAVP